MLVTIQGRIMRILLILLLISTQASAQMLKYNLSKKIKVIGNTFIFGPMTENELNQKPIVPTIIKNRQLGKEYLCMKFFKNQIRNKKGIINLSEPGNFLYAKFNWVHQGPNKLNKTEIINKRLLFDKKSMCHYIGNFPKHELYKVDGNKIPPYEAKDIQIIAFTGKDGGLSVDMGKDPSLVKECIIQEPMQDSDTFKYNEMPSIKKGYVNCQARFRCHTATTAMTFDEIKQFTEPMKFEFQGYCIAKINGKYTCAKVHPDRCADAYVSSVLGRENDARIKERNRPRRFKKRNKGNGGSGAKM